MSDTLTEALKKLGLVIVPREPTEMVVQAGARAITGEYDVESGAPTPVLAAEVAWEAMVDAATKEPTP